MTDYNLTICCATFNRSCNDRERERERESLLRCMEIATSTNWGCEKIRWNQNQHDKGIFSPIEKRFNRHFFHNFGLLEKYGVCRIACKNCFSCPYRFPSCTSLLLMLSGAKNHCCWKTLMASIITSSSFGCSRSQSDRFHNCPHSKNVNGPKNQNFSLPFFSQR